MKLIGPIRIVDFADDYAAELRKVFYSSVHENAKEHYTEKQLDVWAPAIYDLRSWSSKIARLRPFVALIEDRVVGYADLQQDGYIDHFYVRGGFSGKGIGSALMKKILEVATKKGMDRLYSEVSLAAQKLFMKHDFRIVEKQTVQRKGIELVNAIMERKTFI